MPDEVSKPLSAFGFLTAIEDAQHGFFGGYLVVSTWGRPIEFHCTTPVLPNPAQRILYGASLRPYLLGELIGLTLLKKAKTPVALLLTDQREMLSLGHSQQTPLAWVREADNLEIGPSPSDQFRFGRYLMTAAELASGNATLRELVEPLANHVDLSEPFQRIREAIDEAQRISEPTDEQGDESSAAA